MEFTVKKVGPEKLPEIDEWIHKRFLPSLPPMVAFGVDTTQRLPFPHGPDPGSVSIFLQATDAQGNMIGLVVIKEVVAFDSGPHTSPEWNRMVDFMHFIDQDAKLDELPKGMTEMLVGSVADEWRGRGVIKQLVLEAEAAAQDAGFKSMLVCCTGEYSSRAIRSLGWREHYRLAYKDYPSLSGKDVKMVPTPPHEHVYFFIKEF